MQTQTERYSGLMKDVIEGAGKAGRTLTDSLRHTAKTAGLKPHEIEMVGGLINRAASMVHCIERDTSTRADAFELADPPAVIADLFGVDHAAQSSYSTVFHSGMRPSGSPSPSNGSVKRTATVQLMKKHAQLVDRFAEEAGTTLAVSGKLQKALEQDRDEVIHRAGRLFEELCNRVASLDERAQKAYVRRTVNLFDTEGRKLLSRVASSVELPPIPERAHYSAVFPLDPVYTCTQDLIGLLRRGALINESLRLVPRMASDGLMQDFFANAAANMVPSSMGDRLKSAQTIQSARNLKSMDSLADVGAIAASTAAELKKYRTRRQFMETVLDNPNLRRYKLPELADAFNNVAQMDEAAVQKPFLMGNLMLQLLNSGGVVDTFQLGQMTDIASKGAKARDSERALREQEDVRKFADKEAEKLIAVQGEQDNILQRAEQAREAKREKREQRRDDRLRKKTERFTPLKERNTLAGRTVRRFTDVSDQLKREADKREQEAKQEHAEKLASMDRKTDFVVNHGMANIEKWASQVGLEPERLKEIHDAALSGDLMAVSTDDLAAYRTAVRGMEEDNKERDWAEKEHDRQVRESTNKTEEDRRKAKRAEETRTRDVKNLVNQDIRGILAGTNVSPGSEAYRFLEENAKTAAGIDRGADILDLGERAKKGDREATRQFREWTKFMGRLAPALGQADKMTDVLDRHTPAAERIYSGGRAGMRSLLTAAEAGLPLEQRQQGQADRLKAVVVQDMAARAGEDVARSFDTVDLNADETFQKIAKGAGLPQDFPPTGLLELAVFSRMPRDIVESADGWAPSPTKQLINQLGFRSLEGAAESVGISLREVQTDPLLGSEAKAIEEGLRDKVRDLRSNYGNPDR